MLPHFLVIGAPKSGTNWFRKQMEYHSDIYIPPVRAGVHYFNVPHFPMIMLLFSRYPRVRYWMQKKVKDSLQDLNRKKLNWYMRYFLLPRNDQWYAALFTPKDNQLAGDITPSYGRLDSNQVAKVFALMPDIKIIYLLRNPILRMWSWTAQAFSKRFAYQGVHSIDEQTIMGFLQTTIHLRDSQYLSTLQQWENRYPKENIFIGYFEQLENNPVQLLKNIYQFLELDFSEKYISEAVDKKVNARQYPEIPDYFAHYLAQRLYGEIEQLNYKLNNEYTESWLVFANNYK